MFLPFISLVLGLQAQVTLSVRPLQGRVYAALELHLRSCITTDTWSSFKIKTFNWRLCKHTHTHKKKIRNLESSQLWLHMSVMLVLGSCDKTLHLLASFSYAGRCYFKIKTWTRAAGHPLKARLITQTSKKKKKSQPQTKQTKLFPKDTPNKQIQNWVSISHSPLFLWSDEHISSSCSASYSQVFPSDPLYGSLGISQKSFVYIQVLMYSFFSFKTLVSSNVYLFSTFKFFRGLVIRSWVVSVDAYSLLQTDSCCVPSLFSLLHLTSLRKKNKIIFKDKISKLCCLELIQACLKLRDLIASSFLALS